MPQWFFSAFGAFLSWWGAFIVSAIDSSVLFVVPFANDALVIYLAARDPQRFWLYAVMTTAGSMVGAAATYWIGRKAGQAGLPRLVPPIRLRRLKSRVKKSGAGTLALAAVVPPPFPLTPFVLTCGALDVDRRRFFLVFAGARLVRFGSEATLARKYGERVLTILRSDTVQAFVVLLVAVAIAGTVTSGIVLWHQTRRPASGADG